MALTPLPDASAERVEALVTEPLENTLRELRRYAFTTLIALRWAGPDEPSRSVLNRTDLVQRYGAAEEEVLVSIDPLRANAVRLMPGAVAAALRAADAKVAAGTLQNTASQVSVEVFGELDSIERIQRTPLKINAAGEVVRVADIAEVSRLERTC